jgi:aminoglycoside 6'-N-acetyltransferase I
MSEWRVASPNLGQMTVWRQMRKTLWPEMTEAENLHETEAMMTATSRFFVRIALNTEDNPVGFVEATVRNNYVNGCATSPVVFLEGIYVEPWARRQGIARTLVGAGEEWGRKMDCREFASDALLENSDSHSMHHALGFEETERVVYFRKDLLS